MKKVIAIVLACFCLLSQIGIMTCTAAESPQESAGASPFAFSGGMSKEVLRNYASRAVTYAGLCAEGPWPDPYFEDGLRMICGTGAKFIGRAAYYDWSGNMTAEQIEEHYRLAEERAALAHEADPELILQACVFEIVYKDTADNTPIPAWVFKAFHLPVEERNFRYDRIRWFIWNEKTTGFWGTEAPSAVPCIARLETQMYFYWKICRYIDAGYEAIHLGQAEMMAGNFFLFTLGWGRVLRLARTYAKIHARRGVVLFDGHVANINFMKIGNRLLMDLQSAPLYPQETREEDGVLMAELVHHRDDGNKHIGRKTGGRHPLGFVTDAQFTIYEFDNWDGSNGKPGIASPGEIYCWGYDDITWFALQPAWYRDQFLLECDAFLKRTDPDAAGNQVHFLQPSMRRCVQGAPGIYEYRANNPSAACPGGFGQEDTIRALFMG